MGDLHTVYEFDGFKLDPAERRLLRNGEPVSLTPKAFDTLRLLVENAGRLLSKERLLEELWADTFVEEGNLADNISKIRQALGDNRKEPRFIETISGRGYRFIASVSKVDQQGEDAWQQGQPEIPASATDTSSDVPFIQPGRSTFFQVAAGDSLHLRGSYSEKTSRKPNRQMAAAGGRRPRSKPIGLWILGVSAALIIAGAGSLYLWTYGASTGAIETPSGTSLAVLPFKPLVAGDRDEALELGMSDTLITEIGRLRGITVRPISSVRSYSDLDTDAIEAGRALRVDSVLEGSIQRSGDRLRISARLLDVSDGKTLWTEIFDEQYTDIFSVQDRIAQRILSSLSVQLTGQERDVLARRYTRNIQAYDLYLKGRYFWSTLSPEGLNKSLDFYQRAIETDPDYALAYAGLADSYNLLGSYGFLPLGESHPKARVAAEKALALDEGLAEAHVALAAVIADYYWDWAAADRHFTKALELKPNYPTGHYWYSQYLSRMGRLDESISEARIAQSLNPISSSANSHVGLALYRARRYDEAVIELQKSLELDANAIDTHLFLGFVFVKQKRFEEAISEFAQAYERSGRSTGLRPLLGFAYASAGRSGEAREILNELTRSGDGVNPHIFGVAMIYIGLGEKDSAFEWLDRAIEARSWQLGFLRVEPIFDPVRDDPRFAGLVRRVGLLE